MYWLKTKKGFVLVTLISCVLFLILTVLAMVFYPGGTYNDPNTIGYSFIDNYFSDLGRINTFLGETNIVSRSLLTTALTLVGVMLVSYFIIFATFFENNKISKWLSIIGTINGVICAIAYMGIGYLSYDINSTYLTWHTNFVYTAFTGSIVSTILYMIAIFHDKDYRNFFGWIYAIFTLILLGYLIILYAGPASGTPTGRLIQVLGQKVIVYTEIIIFGIQAFGSYRMLSRMADPIDQDQSPVID